MKHSIRLTGEVRKALRAVRQSCGRTISHQRAKKLLAARGVKLCRRCDRLRPLAEYAAKGKNPSGHSYCNRCDRQRAQQWESSNRPKVRARTMRRIARRISQTPANVCHEHIDSIYDDLPAIEELLGEPCEVDHIKPLSQGGLHCPSNLQIITARHNRQKGWKLDYKFPQVFEQVTYRTLRGG